MLEVELSKLTVETSTQSFLLQREVKADRTSLTSWTLFNTIEKYFCLLGLTFHFELLYSENHSLKTVRVAIDIKYSFAENSSKYYIVL